jgi:hypothetical protein
MVRTTVSSLARVLLDNQASEPYDTPSTALPVRVTRTGLTVALTAALGLALGAALEVAAPATESKPTANAPVAIPASMRLP